jgi:hypothetical protein
MTEGESSMNSRCLVAGAALAASFSMAGAQETGGRYRSEGVDTVGNNFVLSAEIEMFGKTVCRIKWSDGSGGICMLDGSRLVVSYLIHGALGVAVYDRAEDGSFSGKFVDDFHGGGIEKNSRIGIEKLTPIRQ